MGRESLRHHIREVLLLTGAEARRPSDAGRSHRGLVVLTGASLWCGLAGGAGSQSTRAPSRGGTSFDEPATCQIINANFPKRQRGTFMTIGICRAGRLWSARDRADRGRTVTTKVSGAG